MLSQGHYVAKKVCPTGGLERGSLRFPAGCCDTTMFLCLAALNIHDMLVAGCELNSSRKFFKRLFKRQIFVVNVVRQLSQINLKCSGINVQKTHMLIIINVSIFIAIMSLYIFMFTTSGNGPLSIINTSTATNFLTLAGVSFEIRLRNVEKLERCSLQ